MKIRLGDLWETRRYVPEVVYHELLKLIDGLEKRIASLESKPSGSHPDATRIDFEGDGGTKVPTGESESDIERLKEKL
jgi:hypothetical protein